DPARGADLRSGRLTRRNDEPPAVPSRDELEVRERRDLRAERQAVRSRDRGRVPRLRGRAEARLPRARCGLSPQRLTRTTRPEAKAGEAALDGGEPLGSGWRSHHD